MVFGNVKHIFLLLLFHPPMEIFFIDFNNISKLSGFPASINSQLFQDEISFFFILWILFS